VVSAGFTTQLPLSGDNDVYGMQFETDNTPNAEAAFRYAVSPGYLEAMKIPLIAGRYLTDQDMAQDAPRAVIINESFAKRKLPGVNPIGRLICVRCGQGRDGSPWSTIVGVVGDVRQLSLELKPVDAVYIPSSRWYWGDQLMTLVVRTRGDAASFTPALRSVIWSVDKDQPIVRVATMQKLVTASQAERRFAMIVFEAFALVALLLAATGLYGILAGSVTERTREIGVRAALGATPGMILGFVVRQGVWLTIVGMVVGLAIAMATSRALISLLFGISRLDPMTYAEVTALLLGVSVVACWIPAWRAAHVDPAITLRAE
jgi:putative ABC transport system permease protein